MRPLLHFLPDFSGSFYNDFARAGPSSPILISGEPSPVVATPEDRLVMEEASLASALGLPSEADAETARQLLQLHAALSANRVEARR